MARVVALIRVLPTEVEVKPEQLLERIASKLPQKYQIIKHAKEPIAFGLEALKIAVTMPEKIEGGTQELEDIIASVDGVGQVDVLMVTRMPE